MYPLMFLCDYVVQCRSTYLPMKCATQRQMIRIPKADNKKYKSLI